MKNNTLEIKYSDFNAGISLGHRKIIKLKENYILSHMCIHLG